MVKRQALLIGVSKYENRGEKLKLDNPQINQEIRSAIEEHELDSDQEEKLKKSPKLKFL